jgi:hypothetical protein
MENKLLKDILREEMQAKGYTPQRVRRETGIAERYVFAFMEGDYKRLPAAPYVRGYLITIGRLLNLNGADLWKLYEQEGEHSKTSGAFDTLPSNRYALKRFSRKWVISGIIGVLLVIYGVMNGNRFLGVPSLVIEFPHDEITTSAESPVTLRGRIDPRDILSIGGEAVSIDQEGNFAREYPLEPGLNIIEFSVKKLLGREKRVERNIIYELAKEADVLLETGE